MTSTLIGYARVSSTTQSTRVQCDQLVALGVDPKRLHADEGIGGMVKHRPGLKAAMAECRPGDQLVVVRLDRLTRSTTHALWFMKHLTKRKVWINLGGMVYDPKDPGQVLMYSILAAMAQHEHAMIHTRQRAGIDRRMAEGGYQGRPRKLDHDNEAEMIKAAQTGSLTRRQLSEQFGVSIATVARALQRSGVRLVKVPGESDDAEATTRLYVPTAQAGLCACGRPIDHLLADPDTAEGSCLGTGATTTPA